jgi:hypothetical protein
MTDRLGPEQKACKRRSLRSTAEIKEELFDKPSHRWKETVLVNTLTILPVELERQLPHQANSYLSMHQLRP